MSLPRREAWGLHIGLGCLGLGYVLPAPGVDHGTQALLGQPRDGAPFLGP